MAQYNVDSQNIPSGSDTERSTLSMPLAMAGTDKAMRVVSVKGKSEVRQFLKNLGFAEGAEVTLVTEIDGNVIVNVKGTRVAVSKAMAMRILVV